MAKQIVSSIWDVTPWGYLLQNGGTNSDNKMDHNTVARGNADILNEVFVQKHCIFIIATDFPGAVPTPRQ